MTNYSSSLPPAPAASAPPGAARAAPAAANREFESNGRGRESDKLKKTKIPKSRNRRVVWLDTRVISRLADGFCHGPLGCARSGVAVGGAAGATSLRRARAIGGNYGLLVSSLGEHTSLGETRALV